VYIEGNGRTVIMLSQLWLGYVLSDSAAGIANCSGACHVRLASHVSLALVSPEVNIGKMEHEDSNMCFVLPDCH